MMGFNVLCVSVCFCFKAVTSLDDQNQAQEVANNSIGNGTVATGVLQLLCGLISEVPFEEPPLQSRMQDIVG